MQQSIEAFVSDMSAQLDAIDGSFGNSERPADVPTLRRILYLLQSLKETLDGEDPARRREASAALIAEFEQGMAEMAASLAQVKPSSAMPSDVGAAQPGGFGESEVVPFDRARRRGAAVRPETGSAKQARDLAERIADLRFSKPSPDELADVRKQINTIVDRRRGSQAAIDRQSASLLGVPRNIAADPLHPIEMAWRMLPGIVRNLEQQLGKSISFVASGGRIEVSRSLIDAIRVPLIYLTRNAADHGLETSQGRLRCGKSPVGTIRISATRDADEVVVELSDDGRGFDADKVAKMTAAGLMADDDSEGRYDAAIASGQLAPATDATTGTQAALDRGIGLEAVRQHIEMAGGRISIRSRRGCGVTVAIRIPACDMQTSSVSSAGAERTVCLPNFPR